MAELNTYLISATITPNKIIALVVVLVVVAAAVGAFLWMRNRNAAAS
jgi:hypothetical protein